MKKLSLNFKPFLIQHVLNRYNKDITMIIKIITALLLLILPVSLSAQEQNISLHLLFRIGDSETADENYIFKAEDVAADRDGNILVLDSYDRTVKVYSPAGKFISNFCRKGQGPAEIWFDPGKIRIDNNNMMIISGSFCREFLVLNENVSEYDRFVLDGYWGKSFCVNSSSEIYISSCAPAVLKLNDKIRSKPPPKYLITGYDYTGEIISEFTKTDKVKDITDYFINWSILSVDSQDNLYVMYLHRNLIEKYSSSGQLLKSKVLFLEYRTEYQTHIDTHESEYGKNETIQPIFLSNPSQKNLEIDGNDRLWIYNITDNEFGFILLNTDLQNISEIPIPGNFRDNTLKYIRHRIYRNRLYGISPLGETVYVYRIIDN
ncbi:6-bladed beta-propeller [candidate division KSB1 bacterium]